MSRNIKFYIVDVFGIKKYSGNQLAVFIDEPGIHDEEMQQIAKEINFSETTFINPQPNDDGSYNVLIFTPAAEVGFAGHPSLGSAFVIAEKLKNKTISNVALNLKIGKIEVNTQMDILWMKQMEPIFGKTFDRKYFAEILNITTADIDPSFPIEEVSTGLPFTIVPLRNLNILKHCSIDINHYAQFIKDAWAKGILVFCPEGYDKGQSLSARAFVNYLGIPEDPATGSANGCLAAYLVKHQYFNKTFIDVVVGQGYEIKRESELYLRAMLKEGFYNIEVGGKTSMVAEGFWK